MDKAELIKSAERVKLNAYAPYSGFKVGAALLCRDGRVFTGCNVENSSFGLTICAERTAVFRAVAEGCTDFTMLALTAESEQPVIPCGACLQVLVEFSNDLLIISAGQDETTLEKPISDLLPHQFKL